MKEKGIYTLVILNFNSNSVELVCVDEDMVRKLEEEYNNDVESWASKELAMDIRVDISNCNWMFVNGKANIFEHSVVKGEWQEKKIEL